MTIPAVAIVYTDEETIVRKLTELGQEQALNDIDSADQVDILDEFIADASDGLRADRPDTGKRCQGGEQQEARDSSRHASVRRPR